MCMSVQCAGGGAAGALALPHQLSNIADVCNPHLSVAMLRNQYLAGLATIRGCRWTPHLHLVAMDLPPVRAAAATSNTLLLF